MLALLRAVRILRAEGIRMHGKASGITWQVRRIANAYHVTAPDSYIGADIRKRCKRAEHGPEITEAAIRYAVAVHASNVRTYARILRGGR